MRESTDDYQIMDHCEMDTVSTFSQSNINVYFEHEHAWILKMAHLK